MNHLFSLEKEFQNCSSISNIVKNNFSDKNVLDWSPKVLLI